VVTRHQILVRRDRAPLAAYRDGIELRLNAERPAFPADLAKGSAEISQNISGVAQAAQETTTGATTSHVAAADLTRLASDLHQLVGRFKFRRESAGA
jgi:hypothetical protein